MYLMLSVASLCAVVLIGGLVGLACRHRRDLWFTSDDVILCVVSPVIIVLGTLGAVSLGWRITHGGFAAVSTGAWIGAALIAAGAAVIWHFVAARIRESGRELARSAPARQAPVSS
jgi:hypothetical protein